MKKLITFFLCLSIALCFGGPIQSRHAAVIAKKAAGGGGGPTYIINQDFEGTGTPSGWYVSSGDFDSTASPLTGAQSLVISTNTGYAGVADGGVINHAELWGKFEFRIDTLPASFSQIFSLSDSGFSPVFKLTVLSTGALVVESGTLYETTSDVMSAGSIYWIYWHYAKGTGANGVGECGFSATETRPTSGSKYAGNTNGTSTTNATQTNSYITDGLDGTWDTYQISTTVYD